MIGKPRQKVESGELKICGEAAVRARFQRDAGSILRLYFDYQTGRRIGLICKALAVARKIYRCVEPAELERIAGTIHHGGVVATVSTGGPARVAPGEAATWAKRREALVILDRIGNAHNLGAIARTAAFVGVPRIVIADDPTSAKPNEAAYRVAEGGLEWVDVRLTPHLPDFLRELSQSGYEVVGTQVQGASLKKVIPLGKFAPKPGAPIAIVLGNEEHGISQEVALACQHLVTVPGGGKMESLNVSAAAAILMWEFAGKAKTSGR